MANGDLIRRKALFAAWDNIDVFEFSDQNLRIDEMIRLTQDAPSVDAVEVVHCKDCKFSKPLENIPSHRYCIALKDVINFGDDFFCARGTKMED